MRGEILQRDTTVFEHPIDPRHLVMCAEAQLVREFLDLRAEAQLGPDGLPVLKELFRPQYNEEPMSVVTPFEAEVFSDEQDEEPETVLLPVNTWLYLERTDAETFIDLWMDERKGICRLYVSGSAKEGFTVNGHPVEEVLNLKGWIEE